MVFEGRWFEVISSWAFKSLFFEGDIIKLATPNGSSKATGGIPVETHATLLLLSEIEGGAIDLTTTLYGLRFATWKMYDILAKYLHEQPPDLIYVDLPSLIVMEN